MGKVLFGLILTILAACNNTKNETDRLIESSQRMIDSLDRARMVDSVVQDEMKKIMFDTAGVSTSPIKVLKAWVEQREYSSYRNIHVRYKNVSDKTVDAIEFSWYGETGFGDPADMGGFQSGFGGGRDDESLRPGAARTSSWNILSANAKKHIVAWPTKVALVDGTKWSLK